MRSRSWSVRSRSQSRRSQSRSTLRARSARSRSQSRRFRSRDCDRHDRDRRRSAQFRWSRSRSWCVDVDRSVWLGVWVRAVKLWERQCVSERGVRVRDRRKTFEVKIRAEIDFRCFWLNLRSKWKYFQFNQIYHANQTCYFPENDLWISFSAKTNKPLVFFLWCFSIPFLWQPSHVIYHDFCVIFTIHV